MWKKPPPLGTTIRVTDLKKQISTITVEALALHIQTESFKGTNYCDEYTYIKTKLKNHLTTLKALKPTVQSQGEFNTIIEAEANIKRTLLELDMRASDNQNFKTLKGYLARTHSSNQLPLDYEKNELLKAEIVLEQVKKEVTSLERNLESRSNTENLNTADALEQKIVSVYKDLENVEESSEETKKMKDELYRDLFRCSGKLKKARRRSSVITPDVAVKEEPKQDPVTFKEVRDIRSIDTQLKNVEEASRTSFEDFHERINTLTRQISQTFNGKETGSQVAVKIKVEALKLAWESLKEHLYSENVGVEIMVEVVDELDQLIKDLHLNGRQLKKYVRKHGGGWQSDDNSSLKEVIEQLRIVRTKIACFQGHYNDESFEQIKREIEGCADKLKSVVGADVKTISAKAKIEQKINEYLEVLEEKAVKP